jgi:hypothetical protein
MLIRSLLNASEACFFGNTTTCSTIMNRNNCLIGCLGRWMLRVLGELILIRKRLESQKVEISILDSAFFLQLAVLLILYKWFYTYSK